jgi:hypothetical protein
LHTGVKLDAKQLNIFGIGRKTTQHFWIQSLIKTKILFTAISPKSDSDGDKN